VAAASAADGGGYQPFIAPKGVAPLLGYAGTPPKGGRNGRPTLEAPPIGRRTFAKQDTPKGEKLTAEHIHHYRTGRRHVEALGALHRDGDDGACAFDDLSRQASGFVSNE